MSQEEHQRASPWGEVLSDLVDGRATRKQAQALTEEWERNGELRQDWQLMHLIGDSLRSADLVRQAQPTADLLAGLRTRLVHEPEPLRPHGWRQWVPPFAVAAGFILFAIAVPDLQSALLSRQPVDQLALASAGVAQQTAPTGSTLTSAQPTFAQSMADPAMRAVSLVPTGNSDAVAPFELAAPAAKAASVGMTTASQAR